MGAWVIFMAFMNTEQEAVDINPACLRGTGGDDPLSATPGVDTFSAVAGTETLTGTADCT